MEEVVWCAKLLEMVNNWLSLLKIIDTVHECYKS